MRTCKQIIVGVTLLASLSGFGLTEVVDGITWTYTVENGCASIGGGSSSSAAVPTTTVGAITIPSSVGGYPVTSIGSFAFYNCSGLTRVMIPDCVTNIGSSAFFGCSDSLYDVTTIKGLKLVDGWVVGYTESLPKRLNLSAIRGIAGNAFYLCKTLKNITIKSCAISEMAFYYCQGLTNVTITSCNIGKDAFSYSQGFASASVSNCTIGDRAFYHWTGLTSASVDNCTIGDYAFYYCTGLTSASVDNCTIGDYAFYYCTGLTSVTIGSGVASIGKSAFMCCESLSTVTLGCDVEYIAQDAFYLCYNLTSFSVADDNNSYKSVSGVLLSKDGEVLVKGIGGDVTIPDGVKRIERLAFRDLGGLKSVTMPNSVVRIDDSAFFNCTNLVNVTISDNLTIIGSDVFGNTPFYGNQPEGLVILGNVLYALKGSCLAEVSIPNGIVSIGPSAFASCGGLTRVRIPNSVASIGHRAFYKCNGLTNVIIPEGVTGIEDGVFSFCSGLTSVTIPSSVTNIGSSAFMDCSGLSCVTIPNSVTSIGSSAFYGCSGLTSMTIPESVTSIGSSAFYGCSGLMSILVDSANVKYKSVSGLLLSKDGTILIRGINSAEMMIPDSVTSIGSSAFSGCSGLASVTMLDSVTSIGDNAFSGCSGLTSVTMPGGVTNIGSYAFSGCSGLASMTIPNGVTSIGDNAFSGCSGLTSVTMPGGVTNIGSYAFSGCSGLSNVCFVGNAPILRVAPFSGVASDCCAYVRRGSTGWGVEIPGAWRGISIDYFPLRNMTLDANGGECAVENLSVEAGGSMGELPMPTRWGCVFKGWWTMPEGGDEVTIETVPDDDMTLYAHWERLVVAPPVIAIPDNLVFYGDSCEVSLVCATEGAIIYYSPNGVTPRLTDAFRYTEPFTITDTATIKAVAVLEDVKSEYVTATITKATLALGEAASANAVSAALPWTTGGDGKWTPTGDATAASGFSAQSGVIGEDAETWMQTVVSGAGTFSFSWKVDCEWDDSGDATWDHVVVTTNDVEAARMDGTTGWVPMSFEFFDAASHTIRWIFVKDDYDEPDADYADCAWVSGAVWTPADAAAPIPAVAVDADAATVNAAVDGVRFVDAAVKVAIGGSAAEYNKFKTWAAGVKGATGDALAGEAAVVANAHAAAAYLLGAERLFVNEPTVEIGELAIVDGESAGTTTMTVAVTVKDGASAVAVTAAKVAAMFEATGNLGDWNGAAKLTPTVTTSGTDASGKMTFVVTPGDGTAAKAFLRIRQ